MIRYPKPGTPNPLVTVHTFSLSTYQSTHIVSNAKQDLTWPGQIPEENRVIIEVTWVSNDGLLIKEVDRAARNGKVVLFQGGANQGVVVRRLGKEGEEGDDGWIDHVSDHFIDAMVVASFDTDTRVTAMWCPISQRFRSGGIPRYSSK